MEMGLAKDQQNELLFNHFSHEHPLKHTKTTTISNTPCSGCKHSIVPGSDHYYSCTICTFSLHQLCYNAPRKTQHPAHKSHFLTLLATNSTNDGALQCKACGNQVSGLYYSCDDCSISYHILCSALPISISTLSHPHSLNLEFSPPYDFFCDLCNKPSYNGWLYRCNLCEFDTHLECAVLHTKGTDKLSLLKLVELEHLKTPPFDQDQTTPSCQFSDSYFSLDLAKSYTSFVAGQDHHHHQTVTKVVPGFKEPSGYNVEQFKMGSDNRLSSKLLLGGGGQVWEELSQKREGNEFMGRSNLRDQTTKTETASSRCSSWWKLFSCC